MLIHELLCQYQPYNHPPNRDDYTPSTTIQQQEEGENVNETKAITNFAFVTTPEIKLTVEIDEINELQELIYIQRDLQQKLEDNARKINEKHLRINLFLKENAATEQ